MECKKCGNIIEDDSTFCSKCGARVDGKMECFKCKAIIPDNSVFCVKCGTRVDGKKFCKFCNSELKNGAKFCTTCGKSQVAPEKSSNIQGSGGSVTFNQMKKPKSDSFSMAKVKDFENKNHYIYNIIAVLFSLILFISSLCSVVKINTSNMFDNTSGTLANSGVEISQNSFQIIKAGLFTKPASSQNQVMNEMQRQVLQLVGDLPESIMNKLENGRPLSTQDKKIVSRKMSNINYFEMVARLNVNGEMDFELSQVRIVAVLNLVAILLSLALLVASVIALILKKRMKLMAILSVILLGFAIGIVGAFNFDNQNSFCGGGVINLILFNILFLCAIYAYGYVFDAKKFQVKKTILQGCGALISLLIIVTSYNGAMNITVDGSYNNGMIDGMKPNTINTSTTIKIDLDGMLAVGDTLEMIKQGTKKAPELNAIYDTYLARLQDNAADRKNMLEKIQFDLIVTQDMSDNFSGILVLLILSNFISLVGLFLGVGAFAITLYEMSTFKEKESVSKFILLLVGFLFILTSTVFIGIGTFFLNDGVAYLVEKELMAKISIFYSINGSLIASSIFALTGFIFMLVRKINNKKELKMAKAYEELLKNQANQINQVNQNQETTI